MQSKILTGKVLTIPVDFSMMFSSWLNLLFGFNDCVKNILSHYCFVNKRYIYKSVFNSVYK